MDKMKKKSSLSAIIKSPGRWTGNNIFLKGGLISRVDFKKGSCLPVKFKGISTMAIQVKIDQKELLFEIFSNGLLRAIGKVLLMKLS